MTCFWIGIISALREEKMIRRDTKPIELINYFKTKNTEMTDVLWNNKKLSEKYIKEHIQAIKDYNGFKIGNGHLCSTCDYFLTLICQLFKVNIIHDFNGTIINYKYIPGSNRTLKFKSDRGHFWKN